MGAMFLQDKVERLERDVQHPPFSRGMARSRSGPNHARRLAQPSQPPSAPFEGSVRVMTRSSTGPGIIRLPADADVAPRAAIALPTKLYLLDTSVLVYSLRTVHEWLKDPRIQLVIPLEAINNLDLLKKGNEPVNVAARKATRFLEEKMQPGPRQAGNAGLFCQKELERADLSRLEARRRVIRETERASAPQEGLQGASLEATEPGDDTDEATSDEDIHSPGLCPRFIAELLSAAVYFDELLAGGAQPGPSRKQDLSIAVAFDEELPSTETLRDKVAYAERADGRLSAEWLRALGLEVQALPVGRSWRGQQGARPSGPSAADVADAPMILKRPAATGADRTMPNPSAAPEGILVPPVGSVRKQPSLQQTLRPSTSALDTSTPNAAGGSPRFGHVSILKSRAAVNRSQDSFQSQGTSVHSPLVASRNASTTSLSRPSFELLSNEGDVDDTASSSTSSRNLGMTRIGSRAKVSSSKTAAERMEEYLKSLS
ncbi:uncharacterized protein PSFLO_04068 [Pseudozyma flocculosa]|nr:uncharacterized protein PSFLO_04068 [Pseudozyma flocculosa]